MSQNNTPWMLLAGVAAVGVVGLYVWKKGGVAPAAKAAGEAAGGAVVNVATGATAGVVNGISRVVGIPTLDETTTDPAVARWLLDNVGGWAATKWSGVPALAKAMFMPEGSGTPPPPNSPAGKYFAPFVEAAKWQDYTESENDRLLRLHPPIGPTPPPLSVWTYGKRPGEI